MKMKFTMLKSKHICKELKFT